jgi:hypothetical protein
VNRYARTGFFIGPMRRRGAEGLLALCSVTGRAAVLMAALSLAGCGASVATHVHETAGVVTPHARPQLVDPTAGVQPALVAQTGDPVGDPNAHAMPLSEVRQLLTQEHVYAKVTNATYIDPLQYVNHWERTDQGVDANMPVGAPILAPSPVKILAIIPNWYAGQPLVYWELLNGPDAGKIQYVAEEITDLAPPGTYLQQGQVIARYAAQGTGIEFGWSTINGVTLARATTGYVEGGVTPAGCSIRAWLNALGANAGPGGC